MEICSSLGHLSCFDAGTGSVSRTTNFSSGLLFSLAAAPLLRIGWLENAYTFLAPPHFATLAALHNVPPVSTTSPTINTVLSFTFPTISTLGLVSSEFGGCGVRMIVATPIFLSRIVPNFCLKSFAMVIQDAWEAATTNSVSPVSSFKFKTSARVSTTTSEDRSNSICASRKKPPAAPWPGGCISTVTTLLAPDTSIILARSEPARLAVRFEASTLNTESTSSVSIFVFLILPTVLEVTFASLK
mmetsp:Transcript_567/g.676  ORF Transcript_567/g.676 Transcript_567/m.676 type:complete len:244 (-) Transcript_567:32-763(-)